MEIKPRKIQWVESKRRRKKQMQPSSWWRREKGASHLKQLISSICNISADVWIQGKMDVCVNVCVFVNNSHLFIGLKLYTTKASLRQDVLFGCQKEKLKKKKKPQGGGASRYLSSFSSSSLSIFLWLMTTTNSVLWSQMPKGWRGHCWRASSRKRGLHGFLRMTKPPNHIIFQLNWTVDHFQFSHISEEETKAQRGCPAQGHPVSWWQKSVASAFSHSIYQGAHQAITPIFTSSSLTLLWNKKVQLTFFFWPHLSRELSESPNDLKMTFR